MPYITMVMGGCVCVCVCACVRACVHALLTCNAKEVLLADLME